MDGFPGSILKAETRNILPVNDAAKRFKQGMACICGYQMVGFSGSILKASMRHILLVAEASVFGRRWEVKGGIGRIGRGGSARLALCLRGAGGRIK